MNIANSEKSTRVLGFVLSFVYIAEVSCAGLRNCRSASFCRVFFLLGC